MDNLLRRSRDICHSIHTPPNNPHGVPDRLPDRLKVVAIIPARDESPRLGRVLAQLTETSCAVDKIIVIDDGSLDATAVVATGHPNVTLIRRPRAQGVGAAIQAGYREALRMGARAAVVLAGDGQMDVANLDDILAPILRGQADYVQGDRLNDWHLFPRKRLIGVRILAAITRVSTGLPVRDAQCGYTAANRRAMALLAQDMYAGFGYPNDVLRRLAKAGHSITFVPVAAVYHPSIPSRLHLWHVPKIAWLAVRPLP